MTAPRPPSDLTSRTPRTFGLAKGAIIHRFFTAAYEPIYFDRGTGGRFNAPDASYGTLYAAEAADGAFAESFLRQPGRTLPPPDLIRKMAHVRLRVTRNLVLIELYGKGLTPIGATAEVAHGGLPYDVPQAWSKALRSHSLRPDGIAYSARHDDSARCYALFDHAPLCVEEEHRETNLDQEWFWELAETYGVGIAP